jgi:hydrogenase maturation protease
VNRILIVGYGNTLRGDDAAGVAAAQMIETEATGVDVITLHAPGPELAETLTRYDTVIFMDASAAARTVTVRNISAPPHEPTPATHALTPEALIALSRTLYGTACTQCWLVEIPASDFALREGLSPGTTAAVLEATQQVLSLRDIRRR